MQRKNEDQFRSLSTENNKISRKNCVSLNKKRQRKTKLSYEKNLISSRTSYKE